MPVYVDRLTNYGWKLGPSCHMVADTDDELHAMAEKIGLKRSWHQTAPKHSLSHYDLVGSKRRLAVATGAVELNTREEAMAIFRRLRGRAHQILDGGKP